MTGSILIGLGLGLYLGEKPQPQTQPVTSGEPLNLRLESELKSYKP